MTYQLKTGILLACMIKCCKYICHYWKHTSLLCQWMSLVLWINEPKLWTWNPQLMSMLQILVTLFNAILESSWMLQRQAQCEHLYKLEQKSFFLQAVMSRLNVILFLAERKSARPTHFLCLSIEWVWYLCYWREVKPKRRGLHLCPDSENRLRTYLTT